MITDLKIKQFKCDLLNNFIGDIFREKLCSELEKERIFFFHILRKDPLVELEPSSAALCVRVLQTEEPNFSKANSFHYLFRIKRKAQ